eukprot:scaffold103128_cov31-Tisochrysis_lutea.AAC.4
MKLSHSSLALAMMSEDCAAMCEKIVERKIDLMLPLMARLSMRPTHDSGNVNGCNEPEAGM